MKFSITRDPLFNAIQKVQSVVEKKNTIEILGNLLCTLKGQEISICATDLAIGIKITLPVQGFQDGRVTLSAKHLFDIVKELPNKEIHFIKKENNWAEMTCGKARFNIVGLNADEYPTLPDFEQKTYFDARTDSLIDMIDRTEFAVSPDTTRFNLAGIFFESLENNIMRMVATDGHRLSTVDQEVFLSRPSEIKRGIVIPKKGLSELRALLSTDEPTVGLGFERGYLFVRLKSSFLFLRLIDSEYPDYRLIMPKSTNLTIRMVRTDFLSAIRRVNPLTNEKTKSIKLLFQTDLLTINSSNSDLGEAREELSVEYSGEPLDIGFNSKFLLEALAVMKSENIELHMKDSTSPVILVGTDERHHTYVIMPMRVG